MQSIISGSEELRHHCRRCKVKLATPVSNPLEAFCTKGCFRYFYKSKCILCDGTKSRTGLTCTRPACQSELRSKRRYGTLGKYAQKGRREVPGVAKPNPKVWHLSALGAALLQLVGYIVRHVPRPSLVAASIRGVMCLSVARSLDPHLDLVLVQAPPVRHILYGCCKIEAPSNRRRRPGRKRRPMPSQDNPTSERRYRY